MEIKWLNPDAKFDRLVLAGDIGGTNTNLGLVGYKDGKFTLILETDQAKVRVRATNIASQNEAIKLCIGIKPFDFHRKLQFFIQDS